VKAAAAREAGEGGGGLKGEPAADGRPGIDGKDGRDGIDGQDGVSGKDGVDGVGLKGEPGVDGRHGIDGKDGASGKDGVDGEPGQSGKDGTDGKDGLRGEAGQDGKDGRDGVDGKSGADGSDGRSVTLDEVLPALDGAVAKWMLEVERRIMDMAQRAVEAMPRPHDGKDGVNGKDGMSADDFQFGFDLETRVFSAAHKGVTLFKQRIPYPKYIDVWTEKFGEYEEGFIATFGGHGWIAKRDTGSKPGTDDSWQLFVKKGRDGK